MKFNLFFLDIFSTKKKIGKFMFFLCKIRVISGENYQKNYITN